MKSLPALLAFLASLTCALAQNATPQDPQLGPLKDLDGYFPFKVPATKEDWEKRAAEVRQRVLVSQGLFPQPTKTPLNAVVHGRIERDDYSVEKVFFEAMPGFFVTGNLYRPRGKAGPYPAVLCAHGHWPDARFWIRGEAEMKKELASGGERLPESGRSIFQSLGVQLARMGCVAFIYDMIGNCDSRQLSAELAHGFKKQRPEASSPDGWGFFSAQAELRLQSIMGLQTWSSIRAIDFVTSLADVDGKRIGMTGASGGGTQTFIAAAIDPRITVAVPCVMVSTAMQGGCTCENASLLRVGTGNIELAALFAPNPLGMTAADDWTKEMETKGFPELKALYTLLGAPDNVALWPMLHFGHNYNAPSREKIYAWFNQHFALGLPEPLVEREFPMLTREQLSVWNAEHPAPKETGLDLEKRLLRWWDEDSTKQLTGRPELVREGWRTILADAEPVTQEARIEQRGSGAALVWLEGDPIAQQPLVKNPREALAYTLGYNAPVFARRAQGALASIRKTKSKPRVVLVATDRNGPLAAAAAALAGDTVSGLIIPAEEQPFAKITDWRDPHLLPGAVKYGDLAALIKLIAPCPVLHVKDDAERTAAIEKLASSAR